MPTLAQTHVLRAVPVTTPSDDRSPAAKAYQWASRIMVVAMTMVLPGIAGHWLDKQLGTVALFLLIGLGLGCTAAAFQLIQIAQSSSGSNKTKTK
jgi:F0F1-type ATP synthase assembly protein I